MRYGELARVDNIAGFDIGPASANWSHSIGASGNQVTASVRVTLRTVSPLWLLTFKAKTRSLYCFRTSLEIFAKAPTASRAAASMSGNFVPNWSRPLNSPSVKSKKYNGINFTPRRILYQSDCEKLIGLLVNIRAQ